MRLGHRRRHVLFPLTAVAGPPYVTDDPEPAELHHWEVYLATIDQWSREDGWSGTSPHIEVNYGVRVRARGLWRGRDE